MTEFKYHVCAKPSDMGFKRFNWCTVNVSKIGVLWDYSPNYNDHGYYFKNESDAVMFKLIFGNTLA